VARHAVDLEALPTTLQHIAGAGTLGLFASLMFLFIRLLPVIPAFEMRRLFRELWLGARG